MCECATVSAHVLQYRTAPVLYTIYMRVPPPSSRRWLRDVVHAHHANGHDSSGFWMDGRARFSALQLGLSTGAVKPVQVLLYAEVVFVTVENAYMDGRL